MQRLSKDLELGRRPGPWKTARRRGLDYVIATVVTAGSALGGLVSGCVYDSDDRCGPGLEYRDPNMCVCAEGTVFMDGEGCVACLEHEVAEKGSCVCEPGYVRSAAGEPCEPSPEALGVECDTDAMPCTDAVYDHCYVVEGTSGYCTRAGCVSSAECEAGYACATSAMPTFCERPPEGQGQPCESNDDCAGTDATFCDTFMTHTCFVQGCADGASCFEGYQCCDVRSLLGASICLSEADYAEFCPSQ